MIYNETDLPNAPYSNPKKGVVQAWRAGQLSLCRILCVDRKYNIYYIQLGLLDV